MKKNNRFILHYIWAYIEAIFESATKMIYEQNSELNLSSEFFIHYADFIIKWKLFQLKKTPIDLQKHKNTPKFSLFCTN